MKNHFGEEVVFGPRVAYGAGRRERPAEGTPDTAADAATLRLRIEQAVSSAKLPRTRHAGLVALAIATPVAASLIAAFVSSIV